MSRSIHIVLFVFAFAVLLSTGGPALAQDQRQVAPGEFDFYVLSLSWSPSFCEEAEERRSGGRSPAQCGGRPFSFVVHGLWPQYEHGFPEYCQRPSPRLDRNIMRSMLDLMPAPGLIYNEWDKHGTCSGLSERAYFETIRKARAVIKIPPDFLQLSEPKVIAPADIEEVPCRDGRGRGQTAKGRIDVADVFVCASRCRHKTFFLDFSCRESLAG